MPLSRAPIARCLPSVGAGLLALARLGFDKNPLPSTMALSPPSMLRRPPQAESWSGGCGSAVHAATTSTTSRRTSAPCSPRAGTVCLWTSSLTAGASSSTPWRRYPTWHTIFVGLQEPCCRGRGRIREVPQLEGQRRGDKCRVRVVDLGHGNVSTCFPGRRRSLDASPRRVVLSQRGRYAASGRAASSMLAKLTRERVAHATV